MTRILVVTDAWAPQVNGVVRSLENVLREAPRLGVEIEMLTPVTFRTVPLPTYHEVRIALTRPKVIAVESPIPVLVPVTTTTPMFPPLARSSPVCGSASRAFSGAS